MFDIDPDDNYDFFSSNTHPKCKYYTVSEYNNLISSNSLCLVNSNIRSFNRNFDTLSSVFSDNKMPSIFCLTETRFSASTLQNISGYDSFHTLRNTDTPSGGISIFVKENLKATKIDKLSYCNSTIEVCTVEFAFGKQHVFVLGIYRPHSDTIDNFNKLFSDILDSKLLKNKICIITGDLNICLMKPVNPNLNFSNILFSHHFVPLITKSTRFPQIEGEIPSCLDHIWINKFYDEIEAGIINIDVSDHLPTFSNIKIHSVQQNEKIKIQFREVNDLHKSTFRNLLANFDWDVIKSQNVNQYADKFSETINKLYCSAFPLKTKYVLKRYNHNPWITDDVKKLIEAKSNYFQLYRMSIVTHDENKVFRNKVQSIIRKYKTKYFSDMFENSKNDMKKHGIS